MFNVQWESQFENIFRGVLKIAHYTGFSKDEILSWTPDEINKAVEIINENDKKQAILLFSVADYNRIMNLEPTNKDGTVNNNEKEKFNQKAKKLRSIFTGEEIEIDTKNNRFFEMKNQRVAEEMTVEEFKKYKAEHYGT